MRIKDCFFCGSSLAPQISVVSYDEKGEPLFAVECCRAVGGCGARSPCGETPEECCKSWAWVLELVNADDGSRYVAADPGCVPV